VLFDWSLLGIPDLAGSLVEREEIPDSINDAESPAICRGRT
jgi:hypothetical protein